MDTAAPGPGRRERNKRDKLVRITRAARELFHAQGFEGTTTAQIARRAAIAEGTVFRYVARKEDLLILAFAEEMTEVVMAAFEGVDPGASFIDQLLSFFEALLAYHLSDPALAKAFLREVGFFRDPQQDYGFGRIPMMPSLGKIVDRARARGEIGGDFESGDIAMLAFAAYWFCLRDWANEVIDAACFVDRLRLMLTMQVAGIRAAAD